jgi:hypothetical protein
MSGFYHPPVRPRLLILSAATFFISFVWLVSGVWWFQFPLRRGQSLSCIDLSIGRIWLVHYTIDPAIPAGVANRQRESFHHAVPNFPRELRRPGRTVVPCLRIAPAGTHPPAAFRGGVVLTSRFIEVPLRRLRQTTRRVVSSVTASLCERVTAHRNGWHPRLPEWQRTRSGHPRSCSSHMVHLTCRRQSPLSAIR